MIIRLIIKKWFPLLCLAVILPYSCETVIDVNLNNSAPRLVVEGNVSNMSDSVNILLHTSADYFKPSEIEPVTDAMVNISDSEGNTWVLANMGNGRYANGSVQGKPGDSYSLQILYNGIQYSAVSKMPDPVAIDSMSVTRGKIGISDSPITIYIKDPAGVANYYRVDVFKNDSLLNGGNQFILFSDKYFDGLRTPVMLNRRRLGISIFSPNDTIRVRLISIDQTTYNYLRLLRDITEGDAFISASSPSNPPNNLNNGALGYFAAWSATQRTEIIKIK